MAMVMASSMHDTRGMHEVMERESKRRLSWSLAASLAVHALAIIVIAGMLQSSLMFPSSRIGVPLPLEVALVAQRPIAFSAPPEMPQQASELPPAERIPEEKSKEPKPAAGAIELPTPMPTPQRPPVISTPSPGAAIPFEPSIEPTPSDKPPSGDVAVGPVNDLDRIGRAQALRLASRYPQPVTKRPQLLDTLTVPYPLRAAFAYRDARITVLMLVEADGRIIDTTLYPDDPLFTPTVLASLRGARFAPADIKGKPVPYWAMMEFVFTMRRSARPPERMAE
jgi:outer membrane biosynthesis protein TonB